MMNSLHFVLDQLAGFSYKCVCWPTFPLKQKWRHPGEATGAFVHVPESRATSTTRRIWNFDRKKRRRETNTQKIKYVLALIFFVQEGGGRIQKKTIHRKCRLMIFSS